MLLWLTDRWTMLVAKSPSWLKTVCKPLVAEYCSVRTWSAPGDTKFLFENLQHYSTTFIKVLKSLPGT